MKRTARTISPLAARLLAPRCPRWLRAWRAPDLRRMSHRPPDIDKIGFRPFPRCPPFRRHVVCAYRAVPSCRLRRPARSNPDVRTQRMAGRERCARKRGRVLPQIPRTRPEASAAAVKPRLLRPSRLSRPSLLTLSRIRPRQLSHRPGGMTSSKQRYIHTGSDDTDSSLCVGVLGVECCAVCCAALRYERLPASRHYSWACSRQPQGLPALAARSAGCSSWVQRP